MRIGRIVNPYLSVWPTPLPGQAGPGGAAAAGISGTGAAQGSAAAAETAAVGGSAKAEKAGGTQGAEKPGAAVLDKDSVKKPGRRSSPEECQTCKERKYQDGSNENVSFKSAQHISPENAGSRVRAHEGEHVANAYAKAEETGGKVVRASVSIHTAICPECGRVYVSGGVTNTKISYPDENNPYQKDRKALQGMGLRGDHLDVAV